MAALREPEYTFEAHLEESSILKKLFDAIKDVYTQVTFDCDENGIQMKAMDSCQIAMMSLTLESYGFDRYRCDRPVSMGINVASMSKILKCANDKDTVTIKAHANPDKLTFKFKRPDPRKVSVYVMRLMDLQNEALEAPETEEYTCNVRLPSADFTQICRDLSKFGNDTVISCTSEEVKFETSGDIVCPAKIMMPQTAENTDNAVVINVQEPVTLTFSTQYLCYISKASPLNPQVRLSMFAEHPLCVEFRIPAMGHLRYYLAHKFEGDDL